MKQFNDLAKCTLCLLLSLALFSCEDRETPSSSSGNDTGPVGVWKIDGEATLAASQSQIEILLEAIPKASQADERDNIEKKLVSLEGTYMFNENKSLVITTVFDGSETQMKGTWEINGDKIITRIEDRDGEHTSTGTIQDGLLKLGIDSNQAVVLQREEP